MTSSVINTFLSPNFNLLSSKISAIKESFSTSDILVLLRLNALIYPKLGTDNLHHRKRAHGKANNPGHRVIKGVYIQKIVKVHVSQL